MEQLTNPPPQEQRRFLVGYTLAGVASALLTTVFGLFHVDVFLRAYKLPLPTYATGNLIYSFINTANDLGGAWLVDTMATSSSRSDIIGVSGCVFSLCFLAPFFRYGSRGGIHFVTSLSLYDTLYSFTAILLGSIVTDKHEMSDRERVRIMALGKGSNMIFSFLVARVGLAVFNVADLTNFRVFVVILAAVVSTLFLISQYVMTGKGILFRRHSRHYEVPDKPLDTSNKKLRLGRVISDFCSHSNFRAWVGMEMLLECQSNFLHSFLKTFMDRLVFESDAGLSRATCDWILSLIRPTTQIVGLLSYIPIRRYGYQKLYMFLFIVNFVLSLVCILIGTPSSTYMIIAFLVIYSVLLGAVSSGFHLAMSDMVLEMKFKHLSQRRFQEPSLAGMFMGANALLCKPMDSFLPIVAAHFLNKTNFQNPTEETRWVFFYLLLVPPLVFSCLQMLSWSRYTLTPKRTKELRHQLSQMEMDKDLPTEYP